MHKIEILGLINTEAWERNEKSWLKCFVQMNWNNLLFSMALSAVQMSWQKIRACASDITSCPGREGTERNEVWVYVCTPVVCVCCCMCMLCLLCGFLVCVIFMCIMLVTCVVCIVYVLCLCVVCCMYSLCIACVVCYVSLVVCVSVCANKRFLLASISLSPRGLK